MTTIQDENPDDCPDDNQMVTQMKMTTQLTSIPDDNDNTDNNPEDNTMFQQFQITKQMQM
jgi:hypothetical protein